MKLTDQITRERNDNKFNNTEVILIYRKYRGDPLPNYTRKITDTARQRKLKRQFGPRLDRHKVGCQQAAMMRVNFCANHIYITCLAAEMGLSGLQRWTGNARAGRPVSAADDTSVG